MFISMIIEILFNFIYIYKQIEIYFLIWSLEKVDLHLVSSKWNNPEFYYVFQLQYDIQVHRNIVFINDYQNVIHFIFLTQIR